MSSNPYENPYPIEQPELLYGRRQIMERLIRGLFWTKQPLSQQIVGLTRIGKTSLLNVLACLNDTNYQSFAESFDLGQDQLRKALFVQVDFSGLSANESTAFWKLMGRQLAQAVAVQVPDRELRLYGPQSTTLEYLVEDLSHLIEHGLLIVFLLDEFDRVALRLPMGVSHNLRFILEANTGAVVFITATRRQLYEYYEERNDAKGISPLFNYFAPMPFYLSLLEKSTMFKDVIDFIREPAETSGVNFTNKDVEFAQHVGGRHPDLTRLACMRLFEARRQRPSGTLDYKTLSDRVVRDFEPSFHVIWRELSNPKQDALARLSTTQPDLRAISKRVLDDLTDLGLIVRSGGSYTLFSPVMEPFLRQVNHEEGVPRGGLTVWPEQRAVQIGNKLEILTPSEWKLFTYLRERTGQVCTREELLQALSSKNNEVTEAALDITVSRLRQKIEPEPDKPRYVVTIRGRGYRFENQGLDD